jgi:hypothetical protein
MSSIRGSVEVSSSGSSVVVAVVHSAIPIGTVVLRSGYSATTLFLDRQSGKPMVDDPGIAHRRIVRVRIMTLTK